MWFVDGSEAIQNWKKQILGSSSQNSTLPSSQSLMWFLGDFILWNNHELSCCKLILITSHHSAAKTWILFSSKNFIFLVIIQNSTYRSKLIFTLSDLKSQIARAARDQRLEVNNRSKRVCMNYEAINNYKPCHLKLIRATNIEQSWDSIGAWDLLDALWVSK